MERTGRLAAKNFDYFIYAIFSQSFDRFIYGQFIHDVAERYDQYAFTIDVGPREHFKSMRLYARIMFNIWRTRYGDPGGEGHYFSYNVDMSRYHLEKVKDMIDRNPYFENIVDLKKTADSNMSYAWRDPATKKLLPKVTFSPNSLLSFKRGIHARWIYIDDPLRDPENKLVPTVIHKINRVILTEVLQMVNPGGDCRIVGTPQTWADFYFMPEVAQEFSLQIAKAYIDEVRGIVLWPEYWPMERLKAREALIKRKAFAQEFLATPAYEANSYVDVDDLNAVVNPALPNLKLANAGAYPELTGKYVRAGHDIGKKSHPAHFTVYVRVGTAEDAAGNTVSLWRQIHSKWFDGVDYGDQVEYLNQACECFNIATLAYDNTRGEFEGLAEKGLLHKNMVPIVLSSRNRNGLASSFDDTISKKRVEMINDERQKEQILAVDNNLNAMETPDGHGDSFWSNALALGEERKKQPRIRSIE